MPREDWPIRLSAGVGRAPTELAAFDAALRDVAVANFNLVRLSSVIPPGTRLEVCTEPVRPAGEWGDRLYVVVAEWRTAVVGDEAWAGIGWMQDPVTGAGLFVEHEGGSEDAVRGDITASLASLRAGRGEVGDRLGPPQMLVQGATCEGEPVCALVMAVYESEPWHLAGPGGVAGR